VTRAERSDAARNRAAVLAAADELFTTATEPARLSMDDVAAAAGVGKGTLFRAFGSRAGLVQALWQRTYEPLRDAIEGGPPPLGPGTGPRQRILAVLDAILVVKLDNRHLTLAVEERSGGTSLYEQPQYELVHQLLSDLLRATGRGDDSELLAHLLLAAVRADLVDHLASRRGISRRRLRADLASAVDLVLESAGASPPSD
jgi:AcrR family transcriptional regulator